MLQDTVLVDELTRFDRERIPERGIHFIYKFICFFLYVLNICLYYLVVHAKGAGAFGYFECTHDITKYTKAVPFEKIGKKTPVVFIFHFNQI